MNYQRIMVPLDGSELAESVFPHLEALASNNKITTVELVRVVPPIEMHYKAVVPFDAREEKEINAAVLKEAQAYLLKIKARLEPLGMNIITTVLSGHVGEVLADHVNKCGADLLLMATHGRSGPSRWIWGSVADKLLHSAQIPVFLVRPPGACTNLKETPMTGKPQG